MIEVDVRQAADGVLYERYSENVFAGRTGAGTEAEPYNYTLGLLDAGGLPTNNMVPEVSRTYTVSYDVNGATSPTSIGDATSTYDFEGYYSAQYGLTDTPAANTQVIGKDRKAVSGALTSTYATDDTRVLYARWTAGTAAAVTLSGPAFPANRLLKPSNRFRRIRTPEITSI